MGDKKHIDRIFQENFKDFEVQPDAAVWDTIEAKLNAKKKKRRVIPIWWRYAGVAALLLLTFTIGSYIFNGNASKNTNPQVVDTKQTDIKNTADENIKDINNGITNTDTSSISFNTEEFNTTPVTSSSDKQEHNQITEDKLNVMQKAIANSKEHKENIKKTSKSSNTINTSKALFQNKASKLVVENTTGTRKAKDNYEVKSIKNNSNTALNTKEIATEIALDNSNLKTNTTINSSNDETTKVAEITTKKEQSIEDAIKENTLLTEDENTEGVALNKWSVSPNAAPVYFSSLGKGSSINSQFNENSKRGEVNMSYGLNASYAINKRLTVRSGINRVNMGYNTNDVLVFTSVDASANAKTISTLSGNVPSNTATTLSVSAGDNISIMSASTFKSNNIDAFDANNTSINQSFGFIEVPLELQYAISTKRFGVHVIGGFSSLFLNNYDSFSVIEGQRTRLQEADTNINNTSYSANFGLGLNYKVSKKINLNLEPMFKYQINTFRNTSGDFQPFFIGVYTGFGIKF